MNFLIIPDQSRSLICMMLNVTNVNEKHFKAFKILLKILQNFFAETFRRTLSKKIKTHGSCFEVNEPSSSCHFQLIELVNIKTLPSVYLLSTKRSPTDSSLDNHQTTSSFTPQHSDPTRQKFIENTFHPKAPYSYIKYYR